MTCRKEENWSKAPLITALEPRLMFDGAAVADAVAAEVASDAEPTEPSAEEATETPVTAPAVGGPRREVAFVDAGVDDYQALLAGLPDNVEVHVIERTADGLDQMIQALSGEGGIDAIHVFSHGDIGQVTLGNVLLDSDTISERQADLEALGETLDSAGDILLYGCYTGAEGQGRDFVDAFASATGADVSASDDLSGASALGGDWTLEVSTGAIETSEIAPSSYGRILSTPSVSGLSDLGYTEGDGVRTIDGDVTITNGGDYSGGYIEFTLSNTEAADQLGLAENGSPSTVNGQISIVSGVVYRGDGSVAKVIGNVDGTYDGRNGEKLRINFSNQFQNGDFNEGSAGSTTITGWTAINQQVKFGTDEIAGLPTPTDTVWPTNGPVGSHTDQNTPSNLGTLTTQLDAEQNDGSGFSVKMRSSGMTTLNGYDIVRGPYIYSNGTVALEANDQVSFEWQAQGGGDAYDVYGYIVNVDNGHIETILNETGSSTNASTTWATETVTVTQAGTYRFVFVSGTYDYSGGLAAGAQLYIDDVTVTQANPPSGVNDAAVTDIARRVTFENTSDDPSTTTRVLTVTAVDANSNTGSTTSNITIAAINDAPSVPTNTGTTLDEGATKTITNAMLRAADPDNVPAELTYTLGTDPVNGTLYRNGVALATNDTFTQADIDSGLIRYTHDGGETTSDSFGFSLADGGQDGVSAVPGTFSITVAAINDAPSVPINTGTALDEGATKTITSAMLAAADPDNVAAELTYTLVTDPVNGTLYRNGVALATNDTFTQADIDSGLIRYTHDGGETTSDSFGFSLADGGQDGVSAVPGTFSITVAAINDAPSVPTNTGTTLDEGATKTITNAMLRAADPDNVPAELTYTLGTDPVNGTLYRNGVALATNDTFTQADIDSGLIRYTHDGGETTSDSFGFSLADGGQDGASAVSGTFSITVNPVDDPPELTVSAGSSTFIKGGSAVAVDPTLQLTDPDSGGSDLNAAQVIIENLQLGDVLAFNSSVATAAGISGSYNSTTGVLSFTGNASAAEYQAVLRSVTFSNGQADPSVGQRNINITAGPAVAFSGNGHYYEYVASTLTWSQARDAAAARSLFGLQGYLATVTSDAENDYIATKLTGDGWIGASDEAAEGVWRWVTGPEAGTQFWSGNASGIAVGGMYENWNNGEPNNSGNNEDYAQFYSTVDGWNDLSSTHTLSGYVVEYGGMSGDPVLQLSGQRTLHVVEVTLNSVDVATITENLHASTTVDQDLTGTLVANESQIPSSISFGIDGGVTGGSDLIGGVTYDVSKAGTHGTLYLNSSTGEYLYEKNSSVIEALSGGVQEQESYTFTASPADPGDDGTVNLTVTITGANDVPVVSTPSSIDLTDSAGADVFGTVGSAVAASDVDNGTTLTYGIDGGSVSAGISTLSGSYGTLRINTATGEYTYAPNSVAINALDSNASETFTLQVGDGTTTVEVTLTVNITAEAERQADYTEQGSEITVLQDAVIEQEPGVQYGGGYIDISLDNPQSGDVISLIRSQTASIADGVVTVVGNAVYLGDGTEAKVIGSVDGTRNGQDGNSLRIKFTTEFENGNFETGSHGDITVTGWNLVNQRVIFGQDQIAGQDTPTDSTYPSQTVSRGLYDSGSLRSQTYTADLVSGSTANGGSGNSVRMYSRMWSNSGYEVIRGPYIYSEGTVALEAGDEVSFYWKAEGGGDAYDVYGYVVEVNTGEIKTILDETGAHARDFTSWAEKEIIVDTAGEYRFVFVSGTFDATGGRLLGAQLFIDDVTVTQASPPSGVDAAALQALARLVTYSSTSDLTAANGLQNRTFTLTTATEGGDTKSATQSMVVTEVNDPPVIATPATVYYTDTDGADSFSDATGVLQGSDVDDGAVLTYDISGSNDNGDGTVSYEGTYGTLTVTTATGAYRYVPDAGAINALSADVSETFTVIVTDAEGASDSAVFTVEIASVNDAPLLGGPTSAVTFTEDGAGVRIDPTITITDPEPGSYDQGSLTVATTANGEAEDSFAILDVGGITLSGSSVRYNGTEIGTVDGTYDGLEGRDLRINLNANADAAKVQALARSIAFSNASDNASGAARTVSIQVNDGGDGGSVTARYSVKQATVNIQVVNDDPTIDLGGQLFTTQKDIDTNPTGRFVLSGLSVDDVDNDNVTVVFSLSEVSGSPYGTLTFDTTVSGGVGAGEVSNNGSGTVTITSTVDKINATLSDAGGLAYAAGVGNDVVAPGPDTLTISVTDGVGGDALATKTVIVMPALPNADSTSVPMAEDTIGFVDVGALIADINDNGGTYVFGTGTPDDADGNGGSLTPFSGNEIYAEFDLNGDSNATNDVIGYQLDNGRLMLRDASRYIAAGQDYAEFDFIPNENWNGVETFLYQYTSGTNEKSMIAQVAIYVAPVNDAPTVDAPIPNQGFDGAGSQSFQFSDAAFNDVENDTLTYSATQVDGSPLPNWLSFDAATRTFSGNPPNDATDISIRVTADDGNGGSVFDDFTLTVSNMNDTPHVDAGIDDHTFSGAGHHSYTIDERAFADADVGDALTFSARQVGGAALPSWLTFDAPTWTFSGNPPNGGPDHIDIEVTARDDLGASVSDSFRLSIVDPNDTPTVDRSVVGQSPLFDGAGVRAFTFTADTFADDDVSDTLAYTATLADGSPLPGWLSFDSTSRTFSGNSPNDIGTVPIKLIADDGWGGTVEHVFDLTLDNTNDAPVLSVPLDSDLRATDGMPFTYELPPGAFTDADLGDSLTFSATGLPEGVSIDPATGTLSGVPRGSGVGQIRITVDDGHGGTYSTTTTLTVSPPPPPATEPSVGSPTTPLGPPAPPMGDGPVLVDPPAPPGGAGIPGFTTTIPQPGDGFYDTTSSTVSVGESLSVSESAVTSSPAAPVDTAIDESIPVSGSNDTPRAPVAQTRDVMVASVEVWADVDGSVHFSDQNQLQQAAERVGMLVVAFEVQEERLSVRIDDTLATSSTRYIATQLDGTPLPAWIQVDPMTGAANGDLPDGLGDFRFRLMAVDADGEMRILEVIYSEADQGDGVTEPAADPKGLKPFAEQIENAAKEVGRHGDAVVESLSKVA